MEESVLVLKVACADVLKYPAKLLCRALRYRRTPYLATFQIRPSNLTKLKELEYERGTVISKKQSKPH